MDVRVVAATNKNLEEEIERGNFREDLFYRLNVIPFYVPPLRERVEDIPLLADHFLSEFTTAYGRKPKELTAEAYRVLREYHWPGNVRELKNLMERIVIMNPQVRVDARHIPLNPARRSGTSARSTGSAACRKSRSRRTGIHSEEARRDQRQRHPHGRTARPRAQQLVPEDEIARHRAERGINMLRSIALAFIFLAAVFAQNYPPPLSHSADPQWPKLPAGWTFQETPGVAADARDHVFVFHRGKHRSSCSTRRQVPPLLGRRPGQDGRTACASTGRQRLGRRTSATTS